MNEKPFVTRQMLKKTLKKKCWKNFKLEASLSHQHKTRDTRFNVGRKKAPNENVRQKIYCSTKGFLNMSFLCIIILCTRYIRRQTFFLSL